MEATEHILPPRLEDCALPPDSIKEAFLKAATAVKSRATSVIHGDEDEEDKPHGGCGGEKGGGGAVEEVGGDEVVVVVGGEEEKKKKDKVIDGGVEVGVGDGDEAACVDGLGGLEIGDKNKKKKKKKKKKKDEGPILVGGYA